MGDMPITELKQKIAAKRLAPGAAVSIEDRRAAMEALSFRVADDIRVEDVTAGGRPAEWIAAPDVDADHGILYLHGGGYVMGSPNTHRCLAGAISRAARASVLVPDYRLAPEHPYPAAVDDAVAAWECLIDERGVAPGAAAIAGDSAGGGLTAAALLAIRDRGLPLPAAAVCISPWSDLRCANASYETRAAADPMVHPEDIGMMASHYLGDADPATPYASPNVADLAGLPPLLVHVGSDEVLLDDAVGLDARARECGVDCTLEIWDDMIHVWHAFHPLLPEGRDGIRRVAGFVRSHWAPTP